MSTLAPYLCCGFFWVLIAAPLHLRVFPESTFRTYLLSCALNIMLWPLAIVLAIARWMTGDTNDPEGRNM